MITTLRITDSYGNNSVTINNDNAYPVQKFSWDYPMDGVDIPKAQSFGQWPTYKRIRKMIIDCEGHILGTATSDYWTLRKALLAAVMPPTVPLNRFHSRIYMTLDDAIEYYAEVNLVGYQVPMEAMYPTVTPFMFQWECNKGYWVNYSTGVEVMI